MRRNGSLLLILLIERTDLARLHIVQARNVEGGRGVCFGSHVE